MPCGADLGPGDQWLVPRIGVPVEHQQVLHHGPRRAAKSSTFPLPWPTNVQGGPRGTQVREARPVQWHTGGLFLVHQGSKFEPMYDPTITWTFNINHIIYQGCLSQRPSHGRRQSLPGAHAGQLVQQRYHVLQDPRLSFGYLMLWWWYFIVNSKQPVY